MRRRVLVLVALAGVTALAAGCTGAFEGDDTSGGGLGAPADGDDQRPTHWRMATWNQSGVLDAFPAEHEDYELRRVDAGDGIPFEAPNRTEREGKLVLREVVWKGPSQDEASSGREQMRVDDDGTVSGVVDDRRNRSQVRELFEAFARTVTDANRSTIDGWADAFVDDPEQAGTGTDRGGESFTLLVYQTELDAPLVLDELLDAVEETGDRRESPTSLTVRNATWRLSFSVPHATASREGEGTWTSVTATAGARILVQVGATENLTDDDVRERARTSFEDLDLPEPTFDGFTARSFEPR